MTPIEALHGKRQAALRAVQGSRSTQHDAIEIVGLAGIQGFSKGFVGGEIDTSDRGLLDALVVRSALIGIQKFVAVVELLRGVDRGVAMRFGEP